MNLLSAWMCISANCLKEATLGTKAQFIISVVALNLYAEFIF